MIPSPDLLRWLRELPSQRALQMLRLIGVLLDKHGQHGWAQRLREAALQFDQPREGAGSAQAEASMQRILGLFDGDDPLREVHFSEPSGQRGKIEDVAAANARLDALTMQLLLSARQSISRLRWRRP